MKLGSVNCHAEGAVNVKKTFTSSVLVCSLLFFIGCYSPGVVTKEELKATTQRIDITVFTKDSTEYKFLKDNYLVQGDTLTGFGARKRSKYTDIVLDVSLSFADVTSIETMELDLTKTTLLCGAVGLLAMTVYEYFFNQSVNTAYPQPQ
jgi:small ligand-binding sensory domain FIST